MNFKYYTEENYNIIIKTDDFIKYKCYNEDGSIFNKDLLTEDDKTNITDMLANAFSDMEYENETSIDL